MGPPVATLDAGSISGLVVATGDRQILRFGAVPYAAAPTGARRFAAPQPVEPWAGTRDGSQPGVGPPQLREDELVPDMTPAHIDEDCLTAEVFTPGLEGTRPVLVWIPGGGFQMGAAGLATYNGARLAAEHDLVVVGLNYRLGALGFLAMDDVPTNLGLRDLIAALRWLGDEVAAFGGDPSRITVMGQSAGAGAIAHLMACPTAHGLFGAAILQSGAPTATLDLDRAVAVSATLTDHAGVRDVAGLRRLPVDDLLAAQKRAADDLLDRVGKMPFHPMVDDDLLPLPPLDAARQGRLAPVPIVIGTTSDEMGLFREQIGGLPESSVDTILGHKLASIIGQAATRGTIAAGRAASGGDFLAAVADVDLHLPAVALADRHAAAGQRVWRYRFDWPGGAAHANDLPFTFGTLDVDNWRTIVGAEADPDADRLSERMRAAWASFAASGVPSCDPIGDWPRHTPANWRATVLGADVTAVAQFDRSRLETWLRPLESLP